MSPLESEAQPVRVVMMVGVVVGRGLRAEEKPGSSPSARRKRGGNECACVCDVINLTLKFITHYFAL